MPFIACLTNTTRQQLQRLIRTTHHQTPTVPAHASRKMLASTMQISNNKPTNPHPHHTGASRRRRPKKTQTNRPDPSGPNSVPTPPPTATAPGSTPTPEHQPLTGPAPRRAVLRHDHHQRRSFIDDSTSEHHHAPTHTRGRSGRVLLRKEVIQPHLPVRLPCYDFVPIASPTFDGSLPQGVRPPASGVADFRDVTGGVYKARERIHRGVADPRLLATPTSWRRVSASNPNRDRLFGIRSTLRYRSPLYRPL